MRKILYITGTRADYGLMRKCLSKIDNSPNLDLEIAVCGMHLMEEFGCSVNEIKEDGFKINILDVVFENDNKFSMAKFLGEFIVLLTEKIKDINPDIILLLGDRAEMLGGAIVGTYLNIPTAHLHGGEVSSTVDEYARHAITKLSNIHLVSSKLSKKRVISMGENPENVYLVGAPGLDEVVGEKLISSKIIAEKYDLDLSKPLMIAIQHPVSLELEESKKQILETLKAIEDLKYQTILIYPNADAGGRAMIEAIEKYKNKSNMGFLYTFKNIEHGDFLSLMNIADVMIGNSSSGIFEALYFNLPVVNIGSRQDGRERGKNIVDVEYDSLKIKGAINKAMSANFKESFIDSDKPYGDGNACEKIVEILANIKLNDDLLKKQLFDDEIIID
ncbi:MAG: UDP-N-acetylglucosamine 2-epimerase [Methanobrevibacter sp.]|nr:UDP-N-acetylglucosamine 2-epimerase [Methanobrevibacter sp.]